VEKGNERVDSKGVDRYLVIQKERTVSFVAVLAAMLSWCEGSVQ